VSEYAFKRFDYLFDLRDASMELNSLLNLVHMALRGVWQLHKLIVSYCNWGGSSRGIRTLQLKSVAGWAFMESQLPIFKEKNPQLEVVTELIRGQHPHLKGFY
ncbi:hypothetical protein V8G54_004142, partial [Vigna mungo]